MLPSPIPLASRPASRDSVSSAQGESLYTSHNNEALTSGVSWGAIIGGCFAISALSLMLLSLGSGFGLSAVSPWTNRFSAAEIGSAAIGWLILSEIVASSIGGYLTGRLRTKWAVIHSDEVYFRDTANGFLAWSVALVITATFLASAGASMVGRSPNATTTSGAILPSGDPAMYFTDALFRSPNNSSLNNSPNKPSLNNAANDAAVEAEASRILAVALSFNRMAPADQAYLADLIAARTGLTPAQADKRVSDTLAQARAVLESARKSAAHLLLWVFLGLAIGAFSASYAATIGGRQRDHVQLV